MILFLTYHKITREKSAQSEFYTITSETLARHLELLERSPLQGLSPEELLGARNQNQPAYILSFDDATQDHYDLVVPLLASHKRRALFFVPTAKLNRPGYLTNQSLAKVRQAGHTIGAHSHEHCRLDRFREEDIRVQIQLSQRLLSEITGEVPWSFAPPGGYLDRRVHDIALQNGIRVLRTMRWGYNKHTNLTKLECIPINHFLTEAEFCRILAFRNLPPMYAAKELAKKLVPMKLYERLRRVAFGFLRRN